MVLTVNDYELVNILDVFQKALIKIDIKFYSKYHSKMKVIAQNSKDYNYILPVQIYYTIIYLNKFNKVFSKKIINPTYTDIYKETIIQLCLLLIKVSNINELISLE